LRATINLLSNDTDPRVLEAAAVALGHLPEEPRGTSALVKLVAHDDPEVRFGVAFALGGRTDPEAVAALIRLTDDEENEVRDWATFGLGSQCDIDTGPVRAALLDRLNHYNGAVQQLKSGNWAGFGAELDALRPLLEELSQHSAGR